MAKRKARGLFSETPTEPESKVASRCLGQERAKEAGVGLEDTPKTTLDASKYPHYQFAAGLLPKSGDIVYVDTETTGLGRYDRTIGCGIMIQNEDGTYIPYRHKLGTNISEADALEYLRAILEDPTTEKVCFKLKFDFSMLAKDGIVMQGVLHDVLGMASLLDENRGDFHLKSLAEQDAKMPPEERDALQRWLVVNGFKEHEVWEAPSDLVGRYCYGDVIRTKRLDDIYRPKVLGSSLALPYETECLLSPIIAKAEMKGVLLDIPLLQEDRAALMDTVSDLNQRLQEETHSTSFNFNKAEHITAFFARHDISPGTTKRFKNGKETVGNASWDKKVLKKLDHPVAKLILDIRSASHKLNTVNEFLELQQNGRLHCNFNQFRDGEGGAVTGRMSSSCPNLQNVPEELRKYIVPDPGHVFLAIDDSQIEYRIFAHYTGSERLIKAYTDDPWADFHQVVADALELTRKQGKKINFGLLYAMGKALLAAELGFDMEVEEEAEKADALFRRHHEKFPEINQTRRSVEKKMIERGYIRNFFGRVRRLAGNATYKSLNSLIQGSAADFFKRGVVQAEAARVDNDAVSVLFIHDEDVVLLPEDNVERYLRAAVPLMQEFPCLPKQLSVPLRVEAQVHERDWYHHKKVWLPWNGQPRPSEKDLAECEGMVTYA